MCSKEPTVRKESAVRSQEPGARSQEPEKLSASSQQPDRTHHPISSS